LLSNLRDLKLLYDKESKFAERHMKIRIHRIGDERKLIPALRGLTIIYHRKWHISERQQADKSFERETPPVKSKIDEFVSTLAKADTVVVTTSLLSGNSAKSVILCRDDCSSRPDWPSSTEKVGCGMVWQPELNPFTDARSIIQKGTIKIDVVFDNFDVKKTSPESIQINKL
jgi:hypothetical protein